VQPRQSREDFAVSFNSTTGHRQLPDIREIFGVVRFLTFSTLSATSSRVRALII